MLERLDARDVAARGVLEACSLVDFAVELPFVPIAFRFRLAGMSRDSSCDEADEGVVAPSAGDCGVAMTLLVFGNPSS